MEKKSDFLPPKIKQLLDTNNDNNIKLACKIMGTQKLHDILSQIQEDTEKFIIDIGELRSKIAVVLISEQLNGIV